MLRPAFRHWFLIVVVAVTLHVVAGATMAMDEEAAAPQQATTEAALPAEAAGLELLEQAMETRLGAESLADLNQVIKLCQEALDAGLPDEDQVFAKSILASSLSQRAELICRELFETRVAPAHGQALLRMALADLQKTTSLNPNQAEPQYLLGRIYAHMAETEKALSALGEAIRLTEDDPAARTKALLMRANVQQDSKAREADFNEAVKLSPEEAGAFRFRGMHYLMQSNLELAIADFNAALKIDPQDAETYEARGMAEATGNQLDEALESFSKAIEITPDSPNALTHRARIRAMKSDIAGALADVEQAMKLRPGSQTLLLHANLLAASGKYEQALGELNVLRQVMPDNPDVLLQIAAVHQIAKQSDKAIEIYSQLLLADPQNALAFRGRADAHLNQGQQREAIADYEEALKLDESNSGVLNNLAWVLATSPENDLRNGKRAVELATRACDITEYRQAHILSTLAASYAELGEWEDAIKWSQKSVELGDPATVVQLTQELESYQQKKPWREAMPPELSAPSESSTPPATPANESTAKTKHGE